MRLSRRLLGFVWTLAAAIPLAVRHGDQAETTTPGAAAIGAGHGAVARAAAGQPRIGPGDSVFRDVRTPFVPAAPFALHVGASVIRLSAARDLASARPPALFLPRSRAPPALH